ncbi:isochorismate synthase [Bacillus massiliigorillae]|uniref:isochorismate synthase n=1 Tax=Bacillus massiliigorillae TaxID=1243664 RepID=UPI00039B4432|nr:isochorismate synthase [Bacillus massiliigorillae]
MAIILETKLLEGIEKAVQKAKELNTSVLFSKVIKVQALSPLSFYIAGREQFLGERLFWQEPTSETAIVGLGRVEKLQTNPDNHRYSNIEKEWQDLLNNSVIQCEKEIPMTGPILFGAFSFDYNKSQSLLWDHFGDNFFYVPRYMISNMNNETYFTTNIICSPGEDVNRFIKAFEIGEQLWQAAHRNVSFDENVLMKKKEVDPNQWKQQVADAVKTLKSSSMDKIVLARELRLTYQQPISSDAVLDHLLKEHTSSYIYSLESASDCFIGATPERLVKKEDNHVLSTCLAGSIARGKTEVEDAALGNQLLTDPKNLIEHQYVVTMIKNVLQPLCKELNVPNSPVLMKLKHIQHLFTPVTAVCSDHISIIDLVKNLHPTPALGGLPQLEAVKWIREHESLERGLYGGPIGWVDAYGNGEFAVALRNALLQGKEASLFAGCGIVEDSNPEDEYQETWIKFKPMLNALGGDLS